MIVIVIYTVILLFVDRSAVTAQCMNALKQWYQFMIPGLFPMMLCSNVLVDTGVAYKIGGILSKTILRPFRVSKAGGYCILAGFLFGFPMGAKTVSDLYSKEMLSYEESNYLVSFTNCIGPMYTINVVYSIFPKSSLLYLFLGIYALPLIYGLTLRYTHYRNFVFHKNTTCKMKCITTLDALYESVPKSSKSMVYLGGYMILFQISFVTLENVLSILGIKNNMWYPLLEITGGLYRLSSNTNLESILFYMIWGGACCMLQTYSFLKPVKLSMKNYFLHKSIQAILGYIFAIVCFVPL